MATSRLTVTGLRVVQEAAALGSFSAAAEALGYTQSAISRQVAAMEAAAGAPLFDRVARGVVLTEAGTVLVEHANAVFAALEAAGTALARMRERLEGRLVLGSIPIAMSVLVPRAIARLSRANPGLKISLHDGSTPILVERLRHGLLDVGVIAVGEELPQYDLEGLRRDVLLVGGLKVAVPAGHRLAGRGRVPVSELRGEPWIVGEATGENEPVFGTWPTLTDARVAYVSRGWPSRLGMVAAGLGIAVLPNIGAASVPSGVAVIDVDDPAHRKRSAVALTPTEPTAAARAMVAALRTEAGRIALPRSTADGTGAPDPGHPARSRP
jgi:DNA-binding transcriptional LysR family regulator